MFIVGISMCYVVIGLKGRHVAVFQQSVCVAVLA